VNDYDPNRSHEAIPDHPAPAEQPPQRATRRFLSSGKARWIAAAAAVVVLAGAGVAVGYATANSTTATSPPAAAQPAPGGGPLSGGEAGDGASNARSGPAEGGSAGTVDSVSSSGFTFTTSAGQKVTVTTASSTKYLDGTTTTTASAITNGTNVLVLGSTDGTTITASQVLVQADDGGGTAASTAAGVVPFQRGAPSSAKADGQVPTDYTEGEGTIVSGTTADQATEAALAAYPGGVVDRVVQLSNGEYEVHYVGVNWPHHIFVDQSFKVVGAN